MFHLPVTTSCPLSSLFVSPLHSLPLRSSFFHSPPARKPRVGLSCPLPYCRQTFCVPVGVATINTGCRAGEGLHNTISFFEVSGVASPSTTPDLPREMTWRLRKYGWTPLFFRGAPVHLLQSHSVRSPLCFNFRQGVARATNNFEVTAWANVQAKVTGIGVLIFLEVW